MERYVEIDFKKVVYENKVVLNYILESKSAGVHDQKRPMADFNFHTGPKNVLINEQRITSRNEYLFFVNEMFCFAYCSKSK